MGKLLLFGVLSLYAAIIAPGTMAEENNEALQAVTRSTGQFSSSFFRAVADEQKGNLITSPLSAAVVLSMAAYGAGGNTAVQMRTGLHLPSEDTVGKSGFSSLINALNNVKDVELRLANKVYLKKGFEVLPQYKALTADTFKSESEQVDFSNKNVAASTINAWCEKQTNNRIKDVITPDSITPDIALILLNAVYFKSNWKSKFNAALTIERPFHIDESTTKNVQTMYQKGEYRYGELQNLNAKFIELPYKGEELSMVIILPNEINGLKQVVQNIEQVNLNELLQQSYPREVEIYLPKFKVESTINLNTVLAKLGMGEMFTDRANFSGISEVPLKVSKVIQKAFIEVNEEGSEAAAVTSMTISLRCMVFPVEIEINRPFIYSIIRKSYNNGGGVNVAQIFTGQVIDPIY